MEIDVGGKLNMLMGSWKVTTLEKKKVWNFRISKTDNRIKVWHRIKLYRPINYLTIFWLKYLESYSLILLGNINMFRA